MNYEYGRIQKLYESLVQHGIEDKIIAEIMEGGEQIKSGSKPIMKSEWLTLAMHRMDKLLAHEQRVQIREACACCLGGKRFKLSKEINKSNKTFEERIKAANETKLVFGHKVELLDNGKIKVSFQPDNWASYCCSCIPQTKETVSMTYCYCCGGHVKHHLQTVLGEPLKCTVTSSALSSCGKKGCTFILERSW